MHIWQSHSGLSCNQSHMRNNSQLWALLRVTKTTMVAPKEVSVYAAKASVISKLECISSLKEEQIKALKAFLMEKRFSLYFLLASARIRLHHIVH